MGVLDTCLAVIFLLLSINPAYAIVSGFDNEIEISQTPYPFSFEIENPSQTKKQVEIEYSIPTNFREINVPKELGAKERKTATILIYPKSGFEGTTYSANITIDVGGEFAEKNLAIHYSDEKICPVTINSEIIESKAAHTIENKSYKPKTLELVAISSVPSDWESGQTQFTIGAFEKRTFGTNLQRNSSYSGNAEFVFECDGKIIKSSAAVEFETGILAGFAVIGNAVEKADKQAMFDIFLIIIASILLLAFIARLVRIIAARNGGRT